MHAEFSMPLPAIFGFLLVLARVSGVFVFVPIPGMNAAPEIARVVLALAVSFVLMPAWPAPVVDAGTMGKLPGWVAAEFSFGLLIGVSVSLLLEGVQLASQMIGLQAGFSFASTIDPSTQADSSVLQITMQLFTGSIFFALGLDREVIRILALSLENVPAVSGMAGAPVADAVTRLGSQVFILGLRLALPVIGLLIFIDLSFGVMGKVHAQFQVLSLSFAAKMLAGLGLVAFSLAAFPKIAQSAASNTFQVLIRLVGH